MVPRRRHNLARSVPLLLGLVLLALGLLVAPATAAGARSPQRTWASAQARIGGAEAPGRRGAGVLVAVLDTWVDRTHPDFSGRVMTGADCVGGHCVSGQRRDSCTHGTHVAGTVASTSYGVAPDATVLPVQVLTADPGTSECVGRAADVAAGIRYAVAAGARVLNLSLGADVRDLGSGPSPLVPAVAEAARAGAVVVFSAGNDGTPVGDMFGSNALLVAATGPDGNLASYSQYGDGVDLAAAGGQPHDGTCTAADCITSLYPGGRYAVAAGTSMAAPQVSGTAALLLAQNPRRNRQDVIDRLEGTARPLAGTGDGLLDATAALTARTIRRPGTTAAAAPPVPLNASSAPAAGTTAGSTAGPTDGSAPGTATPGGFAAPSGPPRRASPRPSGEDPARASTPVPVTPLASSGEVPPGTTLVALLCVGAAGGSVLAARRPRRR